MNRSRPGTALLRALMVVALAVPAVGAPAAAGAAGRPIVYSESPTGQGATENVFTMNAGGTGRRRLTTDGRSSHGVMSPDGRWIAYAKWFSGQRDLMVMRSDGTRKRRLTSTGRVSEVPTTWSPNSRKIVFTRETGNGGRKGGVFQIKRGGDGVRRMLSRNFRHADWSPANGKLVMVRLLTTEQYQDYYQIVSMRPDGSGKRVLTSRSHVSLEPRWSPDGKQIVYQEYRPDSFGRGLIRTMRADGNGKRILIETDSAAYFPDWSPDGKWVAYWTAANGDYPSSIFRISVATGETKRLTSSFSRSLSW